MSGEENENECCDLGQTVVMVLGVLESVLVALVRQEGTGKVMNCKVAEEEEEEAEVVTLAGWEEGVGGKGRRGRGRGRGNTGNGGRKTKGRNK